MENGYKVLKSEYLAKRPWFTVRRDELQLPNGNIIPEYYVLEYPDWVNVIALTTSGQFILERQYRHGFGRTNWELPCGCLEKTDESPLAGAQRELLEETGFGGGEWELLDTLSGNTSCTNNLTHCFIARNVEKVGSQHLDEGEWLDVHLKSEEEVLELLTSGEIIQSLHAAPLWKYFWKKQQGG